MQLLSGHTELSSELISFKLGIQFAGFLKTFYTINNVFSKQRRTKSIQELPNRLHYLFY